MDSKILPLTPPVRSPAAAAAAAAQPASDRSDADVGTTDRLAGVFAVVFGAALMLTVQGYQFGRSNHDYLLGALHKAWPHLLANDWFTTQTLQYHAVFQWMAALLFRLGIIQPTFLVGYLALVVLLQVTWWRLVRRLGGSLGTFIISQLCLHVSAGGIAVGLHEFFEDSAFLPSNIANVAMFGGLYFWITARRHWAGACFGLAGLIHVNYAAMAIALWVALSAWEVWRPTAADRRASLVGRAYWIGTVAALAPSLGNLALVLPAALSQQDKMPFSDFVDLYVRLRRPHHSNPLGWSAGTWLNFLWPVPLALVAWWRRSASPGASPEWRRAARIYLLLWAALAVTIVGAGVWFVSRSLVQLDLLRYSIYVQALSCIGAAFLLYDQRLLRPSVLYAIIAASCVGIFVTLTVRYSQHWPHRDSWAALLVIVCTSLVVLTVRARARYLIGIVVISAVVAGAWHRGLGFRHEPDSAAYVAACDWIRDHTPQDAIFLVPPQEQSLRLRARRAIIVNYKSVPQVDREFIEWRQRLQAVLDTPDLRTLPRPFPLTLAAMRDRYESLPPAHYADVARRYGARYVLVGHRLPGEEWESRRVAAMDDASAAFFLYDLQR